ncbi:hypothetical protein Tco_0614572 [Tanacetum coccineum]
MEVEPLDHIKLEDVGLDTFNHDTPLSSREVPSFDKPKSQPNPLPDFPSLDISLRDKRGPEPPIKPHSSDSFRMKVVDQLTIHTPPSPHVTHFHPKDSFRIKVVDQLTIHTSPSPHVMHFHPKEVIEDDFLGEGLSLPIEPK